MAAPMTPRRFWLTLLAVAVAVFVVVLGILKLTASPDNGPSGPMLEACGALRKGATPAEAEARALTVVRDERPFDPKAEAHAAKAVREAVAYGCKP